MLASLEVFQMKKIEQSLKITTEIKKSWLLRTLMLALKLTTVFLSAINRVAPTPFVHSKIAALTVTISTMMKLLTNKLKKNPPQKTRILHTLSPRVSNLNKKWMPRSSNLCQKRTHKTLWASALQKKSLRIKFQVPSLKLNFLSIRKGQA